MVSGFEGITKLTKEELGEKLTFKGDNFLIDGKGSFTFSNWFGKKTTSTYVFKFKHNPVKLPREITLELFEKKVDPKTGVSTDKFSDTVLWGIYKIEKDKLKCCLAEPAKDRPTKLVPQKNCYFLVLERVKPTEAPKKSK